MRQGFTHANEEPHYGASEAGVFLLINHRVKAIDDIISLRVELYLSHIFKVNFCKLEFILKTL